MKRIFLAGLLAVLTGIGAAAQKIPDGYALVDSIVYRPVAAADSTLSGRSIFSILPSKAKGAKADVKVHQSDVLARAMRVYVANNPSRSIPGYRVRIYFDNAQNARGASEAAFRRFSTSYPGIPAYRSFHNPFFKVTVGDFRTRSEAVEFLDRIKGEFPTAFIVAENNIGFPIVDKEHSYVRDTVKVLRRIAP